MKRAGGWLLGLLVVGAMGGGGWFALRGAFNRELVTIALLQTDRGPTSGAILRGARFALEEAGHRAGRYRISLHERESGAVYTSPETVVAWIGTSEAHLSRGDVQPAPFAVSVIDTHPADPTNCYRISPGYDRQGKAAASWAKKSGAGRVFLLRDKASLRSEAIASAFESAARALGLAVEGPLEASLDHLDRIAASKPDLVFYSGEEAPYGTAFKVFSALRNRGYAGILVMGEAHPEVSFLATRPSLADGTYLVSPFAPAPKELAERMGFVPGPHVTAGYYAMKLALDAIDRANSVEEGALHRAAAVVSVTRPCALYVARNGVFEFVETLP